MLTNPESYMRGMPDLLFWKARKIINHLPVKKKTQDVNTFDTSNCSISSDPFLSQDIKDEGFMRVKTGPWTQDKVFAVEVKSSNDHLSAWQWLWCNLLDEACIPHEVCKINSGE